MKVESESEVAQSCPTLSDPMDCSLPGSSIHGVFQARVLEWGGAIALSDAAVQHLQNSDSPLPSFTYQDLCDYIGLIWIIQNNLPISRSDD